MPLPGVRIGGDRAGVSCGPRWKVMTCDSRLRAAGSSPGPRRACRARASRRPARSRRDPRPSRSRGLDARGEAPHQRHGQGRGPAEARAERNVRTRTRSPAARGSREPRAPRSDERRPRIREELGRVLATASRSRVSRDNDPKTRARSAGPGSRAHRSIARLTVDRAGMQDVERPQIERSAGQVDASRRRRFDDRVGFHAVGIVWGTRIRLESWSRERFPVRQARKPDANGVSGSAAVEADRERPVRPKAQIRRARR